MSKESSEIDDASKSGKVSSDLELTETNKKKTDQKNSGNGKYPKVVFLIILNELCERFSFYGLRTVLYIFFSGFIKLSESTSTALYHAYTMLCYFSPILGAIIADGYLGLYKTILSLSIVYLIGEIVLTLTSMKPLGAPSIIGPAIGLIIIGLGTGGIKPCVSAFGGSQFEPTQTRYIETFFSIFYLTINVGSTVGTILTPILRSNVKCFGESCFALAFGVPAVFMFFAICLFIVGTSFYKRKNRKGENAIAQTALCIYHGVVNKFKNGGKVKKDSWLDYADTHHNQETIASVKAFLSILVVFLPLPLFWTLYDQQGSSWTSQAQQLNGRIGSTIIQPDQFQAVNPILLVVLIPVFDLVLYPLFAKINIFKKLLQRMGAGLILALLSFLIAAFLEYEMQQALARLNQPNQIRVLNLLPCDLHIYDEKQTEKLIEIDGSVYLNNQPVNLPKSVLTSINETTSRMLFVQYKCPDDVNIQNDFLNISANDVPKTLTFYLDASNNLKITSNSYNISNQVIGFSEVRFRTLNLDSTQQMKPIISSSIVTFDKFNLQKFESGGNLSSQSDYTELDYGNFNLKLADSANGSVFSSKLILEGCARYTILLFKNHNGKLDYAQLTDIYPTGLHLFWQLIQIFVMAVAEVLYSISGITFAFSQAPDTMKSACQALWYITIAVGNLIVIIIAESRVFENQVYEYLFYAGLLGVATAIFILFSWFYKYVNVASDDQTNQKETNKSESAMELTYDDEGNMVF